jgi:hypothetical protein
MTTVAGRAADPGRRGLRLTARISALLFGASMATGAVGGPASPASRRLYLGFVAAHGVHFAVVARFAVITGGRNLFPGGRHLGDVGGWPTMLLIYALFAALVATGHLSFAAHRPGRALTTAGHLATGLIGILFAGTYVGQLTRSRWFAVPAATIAASVTMRLVGAAREDR